jgi:FPC/CPF motif-containing protein YcgG
MKIYILYLLILKKGILTISPQQQFNNIDDCNKIRVEMVQSIKDQVEHADALCQPKDIPYGTYSHEGRVY